MKQTAAFIKENFPIDLDELGFSTEQGTEYVATLREFLKDLGYRDDRIENLEYRRRDGFIPHSHNLGGLEAIAFRDQYSAQMGGTGFDNCDTTLERYYKYDLEYWMGENKHPSTDSMNEKDWEAFDEMRQNDTEATILFSCELMFTSSSTLNVRLCVGAKDAPYHRWHDDLIEFNLEFKDDNDLRNQLQTLLKNDSVDLFSTNLLEAY